MPKTKCMMAHATKPSLAKIQNILLHFWHKAPLVHLKLPRGIDHGRCCPVHDQDLSTQYVVPTVSLPRALHEPPRGPAPSSQ